MNTHTTCTCDPLGTHTLQFACDNLGTHNTHQWPLCLLGNNTTCTYLWQLGHSYYMYLWPLCPLNNHTTCNYDPAAGYLCPLGHSYSKPRKTLTVSFSRLLSTPAKLALLIYRMDNFFGSILGSNLSRCQTPSITKKLHNSRIFFTFNWVYQTNGYHINTYKSRQ